MQIDSLALTRFRNYLDEQIAFSPGLNLLTGPNGHGKTNLLEAIHYACLAHSQRTHKDKELIGWNHPSFVLRLLGRVGHVGKGLEAQHHQSVEFMESGHKRVKVNGAESKRLSDLIGPFSLVSFSPEDLDLVRGGPQLRRRFLDVLLCQFSADYLDTLRRYNQTLKQRNSLLKQLGAHSAAQKSNSKSMQGLNDDVLAAFDEPLVQFGTRISLFRRKALNDLAPFAKNCYTTISNGAETLNLTLIASVSNEEDEGLHREQFLRKLQSMRLAEREAGLTLAGPHREDLLFLLSDKPVREFASQGQKRSVALSIKLASAQLLEEKNGVPPILLLDDVFAELDENRRQRIGEWVQKKGQVFIANPRAADLPFKVENTLILKHGKLVKSL